MNKIKNIRLLLIIAILFSLVIGFYYNKNHSPYIRSFEFTEKQQLAQKLGGVSNLQAYEINTGKEISQIELKVEIYIGDYLQEEVSINEMMLQKKIYLSTFLETSYYENAIINNMYIYNGSTSQKFYIKDINNSIWVIIDKSVKLSKDTEYILGVCSTNVYSPIGKDNYNIKVYDFIDEDYIESFLSKNEYTYVIKLKTHS